MNLSEIVELKGQVKFAGEGLSVERHLEWGLYSHEFESEGTCLERVVQLQVKSRFTGKKARFSLRVKQVLAYSNSK